MSIELNTKSFGKIIYSSKPWNVDGKEISLLVKGKRYCGTQSGNLGSIIPTLLAQIESEFPGFTEEYESAA